MPHVVLVITHEALMQTDFACAEGKVWKACIDEAPSATVAGELRIPSAARFFEASYDAFAGRGDRMVSGVFAHRRALDERHAVRRPREGAGGLPQTGQVTAGRVRGRGGLARGARPRPCCALVVGVDASRVGAVRHVGDRRLWLLPQPGLIWRPGSGSATRWSSCGGRLGRTFEPRCRKCASGISRAVIGPRPSGGSRLIRRSPKTENVASPPSAATSKGCPTSAIGAATRPSSRTSRSACPASRCGRRLQAQTSTAPHLLCVHLQQQGASRGRHPVGRVRADARGGGARTRAGGHLAVRHARCGPQG